MEKLYFLGWKLKFTKSASFPSGISGILFWLIYFVDATTFHNSSLQNFKNFNLGEHIDFSWWKQWNSPKNASSPSVVNGVQFRLIYFVDPTTVHNSSSQNFNILNFSGVFSEKFWTLSNSLTHGWALHHWRSGYAWIGALGYQKK